MNNGVKYFMGLFMLLALVGMVNATCDYVSTANSTDYFVVGTYGVNSTNMKQDQVWTGWSFFTPRLNFSRNVTDSFIGGNTSNYNYIMWRNYYNFTPTLKVYNNSLLVGSGNYTLRNISVNQWVLDWANNNYKGFNITVNFNKNFSKNTDDLVTNPAGIYIGATKELYLVENTITDYGQNKSFQFTGISPGNLGVYINNTDWAVGWTYSTKTCRDDGCSGAVNNTLFYLLAGMFMIGMIVFIVYTLMNGADGKTILYTVIAFVIMVVMLVIINSLVQSICVS